jgi:DNA-binding SARP family transcriptional activator
VNLRLITLGKFELTVENRVASLPPTHKSRALLTFLVSNSMRDIARERLLELFWRDFEPARAREGLRTALSSIRRSLRGADSDASHLLFSDKAVVRWTAPTEIDAARFVELAQANDLASKQAALGLYGGDFLEGNYEDWVVRERDRLACVYETALADVLEESGDPALARELMQRNPYDERAYAALIDSELHESRLGSGAELLAKYHTVMAQAGSHPSAAFESRFAGIEELTGQDDAVIAMPFVARTTELRFLDRAFAEQVGANGFVALISGEPGIGKTSLLLRAMELARQHGHRCLMVECREDQRLLEAWRSLYGSVTGRRIDDLAAARADVATAAAREMIEAFERPCVLFIDDAHTLQGDSLATLAQVARIGRAAGHGIVISARPEARDRMHSVLAGCPHESLLLGPLERADVDAVVAMLIEAEGNAFSEMLYERSGGHPLFVLALLQSLVEKRALRKERRRWRIARGMDERLEFPKDLRATLEARLHATGDDAVLTASALALDPSATAEDLAAVLNYAETRIFDAIDQLLAFQLIREGTHALQYEFVHEVVREVAATLLSAGRRVALHRAFARRFQQTGTQADSVRLARHLRASGSVFPAAAAFLNAAKAAVERHAVRDAMEYSAQGLQALESAQRDSETEALLSRLQRIRAQAAGNAGDISIALDAADESVRNARVSAQPLETVKSLIVRSSLHGALDDPAVQLGDALEAAALAAELDAPSLRARAAVEAAAATRTSGAVDEAIQLAREAAATAQQCDDPAAVYAALEELLKAQVCWWRFDDARASLYEAWPVAERVGPAALARLCCIRAAYQYLLGRRETARDELRTAVHYIDKLRVRDSAAPNLTYRYPFPLIAVVAEYLWGVFACEDNAWETALEAVSSCKDFEAIANLPRYHSAVTMLEIDALLGRAGPGDAQRAGSVAAAQFQTVDPDGIVGLSDCTSLTRARLAVRLRKPDAAAQLRAALDVVEGNARRIPIDCDRAFRRLADAAQEFGEWAIAERSSARAAYYQALRVTASREMHVTY